MSQAGNCLSLAERQIQDLSGDPSISTCHVLPARVRALVTRDQDDKMDLLPLHEFPLSIQDAAVRRWAAEHLALSEEGVGIVHLAGTTMMAQCSLRKVTRLADLSYSDVRDAIPGVDATTEDVPARVREHLFCCTDFDPRDDWVVLLELRPATLVPA